MKSRLPSTTPKIPMDSLDNIVIFNPAGLDNQSIKITIYSADIDLPLYLWNKHEDEDLISEVGVDGIAVGGVTFPEGKFGNTLRIPTPGDTGQYNDMAPTSDKHSLIIDFWMRTDYDVTNGYPSDATLHYVFANSFEIDDIPKFLFWVIHTTANRFYFHAGEAICANTTIDWNKEEYNHYAVIVDRHATFDGDATIAFYFNGAQIAKCNPALSDWSNPTIDRFRVGCSGILTSPLDGDIDNLKIRGPASPELLQYVLDNRDNEGEPGNEPMGHIYDAENEFTQGSPLFPGHAARIHIENISGNPEVIPFDYVLTLHWHRDPDQDGVATVRLPKLVLPGSTSFDLYITTDGSVYWDPELTQLACTPKMYFAKTE
jgi:hypothetical protein